MAQFGIAYVALGCGILLLFSGLFFLRSHDLQHAVSSRPHVVVIGGLCGLIAFLAAALVWWNGL